MLFRSSVNSIGGGAAAFALIEDLQNIVAAGRQKQVDLVKKMVEIGVTNAVEDRNQATVGALLNTVV